MQNILWNMESAELLASREQRNVQAQGGLFVTPALLLSEVQVLVSSHSPLAEGD